MIIRISTEGQYRIGSATVERINQIDGQLMAALRGSDQAGFSRLLGELIGVVRQNGEPIPPEEIAESDLVLPPLDITLDEARRLFLVDGLAA